MSIKLEDLLLLYSIYYYLFVVYSNLTQMSLIVVCYVGGERGITDDMMSIGWTDAQKVAN